MTKVLLVPSSNGLGHARRLLNLLKGFDNHRFVLTIALTLLQQKLLESEINFIKASKNFHIVTIGIHGLDGILLNPDRVTNQVSNETAHEIETSDAVISDNCLWPAEFSSNFYLFGHFEWLSFFENWRLDNFASDNLSQLYNEELLLWGKVCGWFQTRDFGQPRKMMGKIFEIPLLKYGTDSLQNRKRTDEVWLSVGTTGLNSPEITQISNSVNLVLRESWQLNKAKMAPMCVIGRPGLGTIRDCLAHQVCFIEFWNGHNSELSYNASTLRRLGLMPVLENSSFESNLPRIDFLPFYSRIKEYWDDSSQSASSIVKIMFEQIENTE
jgi:hypothetical protein